MDVRWNFKGDDVPRQIREWSSRSEKVVLTDDNLKTLFYPEKPRKGEYKVSVPKTNTGGWIEYIKVIELNLVKELGKTAPVTSG